MGRIRLSIMVPAYNEENNLENTIREIKKGIGKKLTDYEIIIFDDGSIDKTREIAEKLAKKEDKQSFAVGRTKRIRVVHNQPNKGMGYCYRKGQKLARFEYYMYIPGDNQFPGYALSRMLEKLGQADIVIPYVTNMYIRPLTRRIISSLFTILLNILFGLKITYYNAPVIHKTRLLRGVPQKGNSGHAYQAEILVRLLRAGASFVEVGYQMYERSAGKTTAFKWKNIKRVISTLVPLFWQIQILRKNPIPQSVKRLITHPI